MNSKVQIKMEFEDVESLLSVVLPASYKTPLKKFTGLDSDHMTYLGMLMTLNNQINRLAVKLEDVFLFITNSLPACYYSILDLDGVFPNGTGQSVGNIFYEISKNKIGYVITTDNLHILASKADDLWSLVLIAYLSMDDMIKKSNEPDQSSIINNAYFYMIVTDGKAFEISCKDPHIDAKLKFELENVDISSSL